MRAWTRRFSGDAARADRPAAVAAALLAALSTIGFVALVAEICASLGVSVGTAIFGPLPGNPAIVWVYFTAPAVALQGLVALALRRNAPWPRAAGAAGALAIAGVAGLFLVVVGFEAATWLVTG